MPRPIGNVLLLLLVVGASIAAAATPYSSVRGYLDRQAGDGAADPYTPALHLRLQIAAAAFGLTIAAVILWALLRRRTSRGSLVALPPGRVLRQWAFRTWREERWKLLALTLLAAAVRVPFLDQPMRYDESYTYNTYASQPWFVVLSKYDAPNNHVAHSLLVWASVHVFGGAPWAIRLPACLAGILLVPATMWLARMTAGSSAGGVAGVIVAASSPLIEYSANARGYSQLCLLTVCGWIAAACLARRRGVVAGGAWVAANALGAWTIPIMLYPASMQAVWLLVMSGRRRQSNRGVRLRDCALLFVLTGLTTAVLYSPVLLVHGPRAILGQAEVQALSWLEYTGKGREWLVAVIRLLLRDMPLATLAVHGIAIPAALFALHRNSAALRWAVSSLAAPAALLLIQRVQPFPRVGLFLLPLEAVVVASGAATVLALLSTRGQRIACGVLLCALLGAGPLVLLTLRDSVRRSTETGVLPEAEAIIRDLGDVMTDCDRLATVSPGSAQIVYYAKRQGWDMQRFAGPDASCEEPFTLYLIVHRQPRQSVHDVFAQTGWSAMASAARAELRSRHPAADIYRIAVDLSPKQGE